MSVAMTARYTKENKEFDGLVSIESVLVDEAMEGKVTRYVVVSLIEVVSVAVSVADGTRQPKVNTVATEVMQGDDEAACRAMLDKAFRRRTGRSDTAPPTLFDPPVADAETPARPEGMAIHPPRGSKRQDLTDVEPVDDAAPGDEVWPGDVEFKAPDGEPTGDTDTPDPGDTNGGTARRGRRRS